MKALVLLLLSGCATLPVRETPTERQATWRLKACIEAQVADNRNNRMVCIAANQKYCLDNGESPDCGSAALFNIKR
jgi:hypothetical protein